MSTAIEFPTFFSLQRIIQTALNSGKFKLLDVVCYFFHISGTSFETMDSRMRRDRNGMEDKDEESDKENAAPHGNFSNHPDQYIFNVCFM